MNVVRSVAGVAMAIASIGGAQETNTTVPAGSAVTGVELICLTEHPALLEGASTTLQAWVSTPAGLPVKSPVELRWQVDSGQLDAQATLTRWDLSQVHIEPQQEEKTVRATVDAFRGGQKLASCSVEVLIGKNIELPPDRAAVAEDLFSAKHYLLPNRPVAPGYGLYSYLLFSARLRDAEQRTRYLNTIEACLSMMSDVDEYLSRHVRPRSLNVTYIPVLRTPPRAKAIDEWANAILEAYDYATASILLAAAHKEHGDGPYILSTLGPATPDAPVRLWEDFTGVAPELAWDRLRFFTFLAAQQRTWSQETVRRLALAVRNIIAVGGKVLPNVLDVAEKAIHFETTAKSPER